MSRISAAIISLVLTALVLAGVWYVARVLPGFVRPRLAVDDLFVPVPTRTVGAEAFSEFVGEGAATPSASVPIKADVISAPPPTSTQTPSADEQTASGAVSGVSDISETTTVIVE